MGTAQNEQASLFAIQINSDVVASDNVKYRHLLAGQQALLSSQSHLVLPAEQTGRHSS